MKQRVLLVQALLGNPGLLILDEPTAGLDPGERINLRNIISDFSDNKVVLFATHVVSDIDYISKEVILLDRGHIVKSGPVGDLLAGIEGKVGEILVDEGEVAKIRQDYMVENMTRTASGIIARVVGDNIPAESMVTPASINLEDAYLYYVKGRDTWEE